MVITVIGKITNTGTHEKIKFDTENKKYCTGKYNVIGGDLCIQASSNAEIKDIVYSLQNQGFEYDIDL